MVEQTSRRYVIVSPCRNEADFLEATIRSVTEQTVLPDCWVIVDDGSTDATPEILANAAKRHPFIKPVRREDRGSRSLGSGVVDTFYHGLEQVKLGDYDYVCKLDCDLELSPRYFERAMECCEAEPRLGTISGKLRLKLEDGRIVHERIGDENSVGAVKFYRRTCFEDIGGFVRGVCWDGIDGHMCRLKGWIAASREDPDLTIIHLRQMGSSHVSLWTGRKRWGRGKYFMGSAPYYVAAVSIYRMAERPFVVGGVGIFWGYLRAALDREPRMDKRDYLESLRRFELGSLLMGKRRMVERMNREIRLRSGT
jgi:biofilm PGA synthesis N-glycosyltransferase PgaC